MRKRRVQGSSRKTRSTTKLAKTTAQYRRFIGVSLSGGKSDKACIAAIEYFPEHGKIFLSKLFEKVKAEEFISADLKIHEILSQNKDRAEIVAFDVPLSLPKCLTCQLVCPGYEICKEPEITYIRKLYQSNLVKKKPKKMYTPYTQRCADTYLAIQEPELDVQHALGANLAPMTARAHFIVRRLKMTVIEVHPKLSVWKIGQLLKVNKSQLKIYKNSIGGAEAREIFLRHIVEISKVFIYQQDLRLMIENFHAFDAFICAYTAFLKATGQTESPPMDYPKGEIWITIPKSP